VAILIFGTPCLIIGPGANFRLGNESGIEFGKRCSSSVSCVTWAFVTGGREAGGGGVCGEPWPSHGLGYMYDQTVFGESMLARLHVMEGRGR
jgi:hypothetical protein